jgi:hypothetical protein
MTRIGRMAGTALAVVVLAMGMSSCQKKEGPVERAGKAIDKTVESAGQQLEKAGQGIQDAAKDARK